MKYEKSDLNQIMTVKIKLDKNKKMKAKNFAKLNGYSFQDWLGNLVIEELQRNGILSKDIS